MKDQDQHGRSAPLLMVMITIAALVLPGAVFAADQRGLHDLWAQLLQKHVRDGRVDYTGFQRDETILDRYLDQLAAVDPEQLSRDSQFAFYTNAYNAWTVKLILSKYPDVESIKDFGGLLTSPWEKPLVRISGQTLTLDHVEHEILRERFKDPRVHFAVNCASISCPPLLPEPFRGETLDRQLDEATRRFLNDPGNYRFENSNFYVSRIFKWYGEDFDGDIIGFYLKYAEGGLKDKLQAAGEQLTLRYLDYDWSLNDV